MSQTRKVSGRATTIVRGPDLGVGVQYHNTVVAYLRSGVVTLNSGGWRTNTTKLRMNQFANQFCASKFSVYQRDYEWFVRTPQGDVEFFDGMEVTL